MYGPILPTHPVVRDAALRALAAVNGGLLRWSDAMLVGLHPDDVRNALRGHHWLRLQRGVYAAEGVDVTPAVRARAAVLSPDLWQRVVASHHTAARLHGLPLVRDTRHEHVTVQRIARRPQRPELWLYAHTLKPHEVTVVDRVACTTVARTLVDLLLRADRITATWACECAVRDGLVSLDDVRAQAISMRRVPGIRRARDLLGTVEPASESPLETAVRLVLCDARLPRPVVQLPVTDDAGREIYRTDLGYRAERIAVEADGRAVHEAPAAVLRDRWRQNDLVTSGWLVLRFTWKDALHRPNHIAATVRRALLARQTATCRGK